MRRARLGLLLVLVTAVAGGACTNSPAAVPRTSLPVIERQVMCVTCKIPLNVAQSPQADRERAYIQSLIDEGETEAIRFRFGVQDLRDRPDTVGREYAVDVNLFG